ncbi:hypothetical protein ACHAXT_003415 [Thalassiosira profunda]
MTVTAPVAPAPRALTPPEKAELRARLEARLREAGEGDAVDTDKTVDDEGLLAFVLDMAENGEAAGRVPGELLNLEMCREAEAEKIGACLAEFFDSPKRAASLASAIAKAPMELQIPLAHDWTTGMQIRDDKGEVLFHVAKEFNFGSDVDPQYAVVLMDPEKSLILSLIKFKRGGKWGSWCKIYLNEPSYEGQPVAKSTNGKSGWGSVPWRDCVQGGVQALYLHGKLFLKKYSGPKKKETVFHYKRAVGGVIEFTEPETGIVKLTRIDCKQSISVAAGQNILEAVALAYATDRRYKFLGSTTEMKARKNSLMHPFAKQGHLYELSKMGVCTKDDLNAATSTNGEVAGHVAGSLAGSLLGAL